MKVLGEREIPVAVKLYSIVEMIGNENEKKKTKVKAPIMMKKIKSDKLQTCKCRYSLDLAMVPNLLRHIAWF